ncbi:MAG: hypothetical protein WC856_00315 [Methylococcaceae bacterium]|jgi:hypothetical protein
MEYFSDQLKGPQLRDIDVIPSNVWGGIVAIINGLISSGAFGEYFPEICPDPNATGVFATDVHDFKSVLKAEVPDIEFPFITEKVENGSWMPESKPFVPNYLAILDLIQFCHDHVAKPNQGFYHSYYKHHHLSFDIELGQEEFRSKINRIFARNGISFELQSNGNIVRLAPVVLAEALYSARFQTQDQTLNVMLEDARTKFLNPDEEVRRESLERLWDAWERIKTVLTLKPNDKKESISKLLDKCADEPNFRELLESEAKTLTTVGNTFHIRHSEIGQIEIQRNIQVDYLFHRLFSMILLAIKSMA